MTFPGEEDETGAATSIASLGVASKKSAAEASARFSRKAEKRTFSRFRKMSGFTDRRRASITLSGLEIDDAVDRHIHITAIGCQGQPVYKDNEL